MAKVLSSGVNFMRGVLLLLNILFIFVGLALIGFGIYIKLNNNFSSILNELTHVSSFEGQSLGFLAFVLIGGGVFTIMISLIGCSGSLWYSRCVLYTYSLSLFILMVIELAGLILALAYKEKLESVYKDGLEMVFTDALKNDDVKILNAFHDLEKALECCGANGLSDYISTGHEAPSYCYLPRQGCSDATIGILKKNLPIIGGVLGSVLFLELICLTGALVLAVALKHAPDDSYSSNPGEILAYVVPGRRRNYYKV